MSTNAKAENGKKVLNVGILFRLNDKYNDSVNELVTGIEAAQWKFEKDNPSIKITLHKYVHDESLSSVVTATQKVVDDKIPAVIGGELSEESIVMKDILNPKKIVFITPTSSNPQVTENAPYSFRTCFNDRDVANKLSDFVVDSLKAKVIGVIHNYSSPYTDYLAKTMLVNLKARKDAKTYQVYEEKIEKDQSNYTKEINDLKSKNVTHILMPTHQSDLLRFLDQSSKVGYFPVYIGSDGWGTNENVFQKVISEGKNLKFVAYRNYYINENFKSEQLSDFKETYQKLFKKKPRAWSAIGFDTAWLLFSAMKSASLENSESIRKHLFKIKNLQLLSTKNFKFGFENSPQKDLFIYKIDKNGSTYERTLR